VFAGVKVSAMTETYVATDTKTDRGIRTETEGRMDAETSAQYNTILV